MPQEEDRIRTIAGYLLKNNARLILRATPDVLAFVKASVLQAFVDPSVMVRNAAGQDIVAFLGILEPRNWPECLQQLVGTLDSTSQEQQEVSTQFQRALCSLAPRLSPIASLRVRGTGGPPCTAATSTPLHRSSNILHCITAFSLRKRTLASSVPEALTRQHVALAKRQTCMLYTVQCHLVLDSRTRGCEAWKPSLLTRSLHRIH